jgi:hypothetical protein
MQRRRQGGIAAMAMASATRTEGDKPDGWKISIIIADSNSEDGSENGSSVTDADDRPVEGDEETHTASQKKKKASQKRETIKIFWVATLIFCDCSWLWLLKSPSRKKKNG